MAGQSSRDKLIHAQFKKGREVRIKVGEHEGEFGTIKKVTDDEGKRFLRIKLDKIKKTIEQTTEEVKLIPEKNLPQEFDTIEDMEGREDFILVQDSQDIDATREFIADPRKEEFDGYFVKIGEGEITQAYGFNGTPFLKASLTRLETADENLRRTIV